MILNSLFVAAAIAGSMSGERRLVVFRLYSVLTVMFKLDQMGSVFAGLVAFLWPLATLYAFEYMKHEERKNTFFAFYTMTYGITMGIALSGTLVTLYLFYEMLTLVTLPLVLFTLTVEAVRAARAYLYYSIGGAAFAFLGLIFVLGYSGIGTSEFVAGGCWICPVPWPIGTLCFYSMCWRSSGSESRRLCFPATGGSPRRQWLPLR